MTEKAKMDSVELCQKSQSKTQVSYPRQLWVPRQRSSENNKMMIRDSNDKKYI